MASAFPTKEPTILPPKAVARLVAVPAPAMVAAVYAATDPPIPPSNAPFPDNAVATFVAVFGATFAAPFPARPTAAGRPIPAKTVIPAL